MSEAWSKEVPKPGFYWIRNGDYVDLVEVDADSWLRGFRVSDRVEKFIEVGWEFLGPITPSDTSEVQRLREALELVQRLGDKTLIGDKVSLDPAVAYQHGANAAFAQVADIARAALEGERCRLIHQSKMGADM